MIDLDRLNRIRLSPNPRGQVVMAGILGASYRVPLRRTRIVLDGVERIPPRPSIFVMNHTDRYNYFPFLYELRRRNLGHATVWVKGKYYENRVMAYFMDSMGAIPVPSKGYVLSKDFQRLRGRAPSGREYGA